MAAWWRLDSFHDPAVEMHEAGAQQRRVVHHAAEAPGALDGAGRVGGSYLRVGGRPDAEAVLGSGEVVDAHARAVRDVVASIGIGVDERGVAAVVLGRRVRVDDAEPAPARIEAGVKRVLHTRVRVGGGLVGEGEEVSHHVVAVLRVLPEALVELAAHAARDVGDDPVQRLPPLLVEVEVLVDQGAQQAPRLGAAIGVRPAHHARRRMALGAASVLEPGHRLAERGHGEALHGRAHRRVGDLVEPPLLEAALEVDVACVRRDAAGLDVGEAPALARDDGRRPVGLITDGEQRIALVEVGRRVGDVATVGEEEVADRRPGLELRVDPAPERLALGVARLRRLHSEESGDPRDVALPAA